LNPPAGLTATGSEETLQRSPQPLQKKSPSGVSIDGVSSSSHQMRQTRLRQCRG
jgi:hypothetical protein